MKVGDLVAIRKGWGSKRLGDSGELYLFLRAHPIGFENTRIDVYRISNGRRSRCGKVRFKVANEER
jgi:hypothetical protein